MSRATCGCPEDEGLIRHQRWTCTDPVVAKLGWYFDAPADGEALEDGPGTLAPNPVAAYLAEVRERPSKYAADEIPPLLAALDVVLELHAPSTDEALGPPPFRYCSFCEWHPRWPCRELQAIETALRDAQGGPTQ